MIEIVCPNCGARYQVPAEALGARGREVTCSACNHVWHAHPPQAAPEPRQAAPEPRQAEPEPRRAAPEPPAQEAGPAQAAPGTDRRRQMSDIRQMLDEVQSTEQRRAEQARGPGEGAQRWSAGEPDGGRDRRRPPTSTRASSEEDEELFLRDKVGVGGQSARMRSVRERARDGEAERGRLMTRHSARQRREEAVRRRGSGWGYTGFTLVLLVAAVFVGLYALHPALMERYPETRAALTNYAAAVDTLRGQAGEIYGRVSELVAEQLGEGGGGS